MTCQTTECEKAFRDPQFEDRAVLREVECGVSDHQGLAFTARRLVRS